MRALQRDFLEEEDEVRRVTVWKVEAEFSNLRILAKEKTRRLPLEDKRAILIELI